MSDLNYTRYQCGNLWCEVWPFSTRKYDVGMLKHDWVWRKCYLKVNLKAKGSGMNARKLTTERHSWGAPAGTGRLWHSYCGCEHSSSSCWRTADEPVDGSMSFTLVGVEHVSFRCHQLSPAVASCHQLSLFLIDIHWQIGIHWLAHFAGWQYGFPEMSSEQAGAKSPTAFDSDTVWAGAAIVWKPL